MTDEKLMYILKEILMDIVTTKQEISKETLLEDLFIDESDYVQFSNDIQNELGIKTNLEEVLGKWENVGDAFHCLKEYYL